MKIIKRFDYFRKPKDDLEKSTCCGAILSILTLILILQLSLFEIYYSTSPLPIRQITIRSGSGDSNFFLLNLDVLFLNMPCAALSLSKKDLAGHDTISAYSGVTFHRVSSDGRSVEPNFVASEISVRYPSESLAIQKIMTGALYREKCRVRGELLARRIPGSLTFGHELKRDVLKRVKELEGELYKRVNLAHRIDSLVFAGQALEENATYYSVPKEVDLNTIAGVNITGNDVLSCSYYLKVIPISVQQDSSEEGEKYQYSYHVECEVWPELISGLVEARRPG